MQEEEERYMARSEGAQRLARLEAQRAAERTTPADPNLGTPGGESAGDEGVEGGGGGGDDGEDDAMTCDQLMELGDNIGKVSKGAASSAVDALPTCKYCDAADHGAIVGDQCAICRMEFEPGGVMRGVLPCGHAEHAECLDQWLLINRSCPLCQKDVAPARDRRGVARDHRGRHRRHRRPPRPLRPAGAAEAPPGRPGRPLSREANKNTKSTKNGAPRALEARARARARSRPGRVAT
ncbi:ubiquitin-protein transferase [Aureococcus anophagefferens]|uniref:Ubiquitin-protein transferase n=1 Tax=Aureococcus anophagefferens TaxID=44056 RepID=A0ABR1G0Q7_AURAN